MFYFSRRRYIYIHECMQLYFFAGFDKYSGIRIIALLTGQSILENSRHIPRYQINSSKPETVFKDSWPVLFSPGQMFRAEKRMVI